MGIFGWDLPPGCTSKHIEDAFGGVGALDLTEGKTLKGCGRVQHGLNGKDADLDSVGQNVVEGAWWTEDDVIEIHGYRYATICQDSDWTEQQLDLATEIVCGSGYSSGDSDGDSWTLSDHYSFNVSCAWNNDESDEENIKRATQVAYDAIDKNSTPFETEIAYINDSLDQIGKEEE